MDGKRQFSLRYLLLAVTLVAVAFALFRIFWLVPAIADSGSLSWLHEYELEVRWLLALVASANLGAGVTMPIKRPVTGAIAGVAAMFALLCYVAIVNVLHVGF